MNYILRTFFYSLGLTILLYAWGLNPETAQFKDLLAALHWPNFWNIVGLIAITTAGADLAFQNKAPMRREPRQNNQQIGKTP